MAPEILYGESYTGAQVDIFAAGVILFIIVTGHQPFLEALNEDKWYKYIAKNNFSKFWGKFDSKHFSPEL